MRRGYVLFAVMAMVAGGYADAGLNAAAPEHPALNGIKSFIEQQRRADLEACVAQGEVDVAACARDRARARRAGLEDRAVAPAEPAGTDI